MRKPSALCSVFAALAFAGLACAQDRPPPDAQSVLDGVVARLPQERLQIGGDLIVRKQRGVVASALRFDILLDWGAAPARAGYTILDHFGSELERLTLTRLTNGALSAVYVAGGDAPAPAPPLTARIQGTDMSWTDLTLDFLWWPNGRVTGADTLRGRDCHILEVPAPPAGGAADGERYAFVRLWIDRELFVLMQAEAYNDAGVRVRRLWVQSLKKQHGRWMIKDLEVQAYPPVQRTRLLVRQVVEVDKAPATAL